MGLSKAEAHSFREQARILALQIGLRPAARALNISEDRIRMWASRYKWRVSAIRPSATNAELSPNVTTALKAMEQIMSQTADRTRLAMARTSARAFEHCDTLKDAALHELPRAVALEKHGRNAAIAHQWDKQAVGVAVQVNMPLPSNDEREEMRAIDAKLDAIAERLK